MNSNELTQCKICGHVFEKTAPQEKMETSSKAHEETPHAEDVQADVQADTQEDIQEIPPKTIDPQKHHREKDLEEEELEDLYKVLTPHAMNNEEDEEKRHPMIRILALVGALAILLLFLILSNWTKMPWYSDGNQQNIPEVTEEDIIIVDVNGQAALNEKVQELVRSFFKDLENYMNNNIPDVINHFENPAEALLTLSDFSSTKITNLVYTDPSVETSFEGRHHIKTFSTFYYNGDTSSSSDITWSFFIADNDDELLIISFHYDGDLKKADLSDEKLSENETSDQNPAKPSPEPEQAEAPSIPSGFVQSGSFAGGKTQENVNLSSGRYGHHINFERLVLDFKNTENGSALEHPPEYTAQISESGKVITLQLKGIQRADLESKGIDYQGAKSVESIAYSTSGNELTVRITLAEKAHVRVSRLIEPGRILVDFVLVP